MEGRMRRIVVPLVLIAGLLPLTATMFRAYAGLLWIASLVIFIVMVIVVAKNQATTSRQAWQTVLLFLTVLVVFNVGWLLLLR